MKMSNEEIENLYSLANYVSENVSPTDGRRIERAGEHIQWFQRPDRLLRGSRFDSFLEEQGIREDVESSVVKYKLVVSNIGYYESDTLIGLVWEILKHRFSHLFNGEGWVD